MKIKRKRKKRRYYYNGKRCSKGERKIAIFLENNSYKFEQEKTFESCRSPKNNLLRFDFFLPELNTLIEFQGHHHFKPVNKYRKAKIVHEKTKIHDKIKKDFVIKNKITLIEIHHKEYDSIEEYLNLILSKIKDSQK